ncbi:2TM domain-containing protein [Flavobacterium sp.]|uniref:2TM domain-containing protein n=1 Tax=Flavobacterium sp. TaxID=239 RepID=UPI0026263192|nr:2TM domain-containing protein [Flavobacterium sp.]
MEKEAYEQYEYARKRIRQKKYLYYHFVFFLIGSLFMFVANELLKFGEPQQWDIWAATIWFFIVILHFIKVYITDRFMNKEWEREQINRLIAKQQNRVRQLESRMDIEKE